MNPKVILLILLFGIAHPTFAQQNDIDSLKNVLQTAREDTSKVMTLIALSDKLRQTGNFDSAKVQAEKALILSENIGFKKGELNALIHIGIIHKSQGRYDKAMEFYLKSLKLSEELGNKLGTASILNNIGNLHLNKGDYDHALEFHLKGLKIREEMGDKKGISTSFTNIANIHNLKYEYEEALEFYLKGLNILEQIGDKKGMAPIFLGIGTIYANKGDYDKALEFYLKSLKTGEEIGDKKGIADALRNIGGVYYRRGDYNKALEFNLKALKISEDIGDKKAIGTTCNIIGSLFFSKEDYDKALEYQSKSLKISEEIGNKPGVANSLANIGSIYNRKGNYDAALEYYFKDLKLTEQIKDRKTMGSILHNIGSVYDVKGENDTAMKYYFMSLKIKEEIGDKNGILNDYNNIGSLNLKKAHQPNLSSDSIKNLLARAKWYGEQGLKMGKETASKFEIKDSYLLLSGCDSYAAKIVADSSGASLLWKSAYNYYKLYSVVKDSVFNEESEKQISEMQTKYETEKKDNEITLLNKDKEVQELKLKEQQSELLQASLLRQKKENEIELLNQQQEIQILNLGKKESELKEQKLVTESKNKEVKLLNKDKQMKEAEINRQKTIRNSVTGGLAAVILFSLIVYRQRNRIAKEKQRSEELLLNILPSEVADELKAKGSADAKQFDDVTVMFTDFKDFTQISEKLSPSELVAEIDHCFKAFDNIIGKHNIEKIKTIGDSYMCAGGLPVANKTNAMDVVNAALEIQQFMQQHLLQRKKAGKEPFEIRIGLHTGPVVAGIVGVKKFAYDIWGDTVNIASRMESSGETGKVNISGATYEVVKEKFTCTHRGKIQAKNKGEIDMYFVSGSK